MNTKHRCGWVKLSDPVYVAYHDEEWGKPIHDDVALFELFSLETQSAGLSWLTVLKKRDGYAEAFGGFDIKKVATYTSGDVDRILESGKVIKSRPKIEAVIQNAKHFIDIKKEYGSLDAYFWSKVDGKTIVNDLADYKTTASTSEISDKMIKELKKRGFKFIGSTTIYAFMQACGMVNDHENECWCKNQNNNVQAGVN
jgi:DNA-3-methyladenine glycosylase I